MNVRKEYKLAKHFDLFGKEYTLDYVDSIKSEKDNEVTYGITCHPEGTIHIAKNIRNLKRSKKDLEITKLHEIMHAIFDAGSYNRENDDEPLVEWCARCLYSLKQQGVL